jgi:hypothetical protein
MPEQSLDECALVVIRHLRASGRADIARGLERALSAAKDDALADAMLTDVIRSCHVRALGDLHMPALQWPEWLKLLENLSAACQRELDRRKSSRHGVA